MVGCHQFGDLSTQYFIKTILCRCPRSRRDWYLCPPDTAHLEAKTLPPSPTQGSFRLQSETTPKRMEGGMTPCGMAMAASPEHKVCVHCFMRVTFVVVRRVPVASLSHCSEVCPKLVVMALPYPAHRRLGTSWSNCDDRASSEVFRGPKTVLH